jgi:RNA polymerase sigma-70 factor (sigma-E family)
MNVDESARHGAVAALFSAHADDLLRLAVLLVGERGAAEELVQEAFTRLWQRWGSLRDPGASIGYLRVTIVNLARGSFRRRMLRARSSGMVGLAPASVDPPDVAERLDLLRALGRLSPRKRACLILRFYSDLTEEETARTLGVAVGTVKSQTHRALAQLARLLPETSLAVGDRAVRRPEHDREPS